MKLRKGDTVKILTGKDRGRSGKVIRVYPNAEKLTVEGVNVYKKHSRPKKQGEKGEIVSVVRPLRASNVAFVCPKCGKAVRVGYRFSAIGGSASGGENKKRKARYCKKCNAEI